MALLADQLGGGVRLALVTAGDPFLEDITMKGVFYRNSPVCLVLHDACKWVNRDGAIMRGNDEVQI